MTASGQVRLADVAQLASAEVASFRVRAVRVGSAGMRTLVNVLAGEFGVAGESRRTLAVEAPRGVDAGGLRPAREVGVQTFVDVDAALVLPSRQRPVARLTLAVVAARRVVAHRVGTARVAPTLVHIVTFGRGVPRVSGRAEAGVAARSVLALGVEAARVGVLTLVHVVAGDRRVPGEALLALADVVARQVAALGVLHAQRGQGGNLALVDVVAVEAVALVAREAGAVEAAHGVGAVGEHVARPVLALVLVGHLASLAAVAVVAVAQVVQAGAISAPGHLRVAVVSVRALEIPGEFVGSLEALRDAIAELR